MPLPNLQHILSLLEKGHADEAVPELEHLVEVAPAYAAAYVALARAYEAERRWNDALHAWQKARLLAPNSPSVRQGLRRLAAAMSHPGATPEAPVEAPTWTKVGEVVQAEPETETESETESETETETETETEEAPPDFEDLDRLIEELESARIVPDPEPEAIPPPDLESEIEDMVSETLAKIYASQNQFEEAARVYEKLAAQQPERATEFLHLATEMRRRTS